MDFQKLCDGLFNAYFDARRNKRNTRNQLLFETGFESSLFDLASEIWDRTYKPRPSVCFIVKRPVKREVFAAEFRDRVVHHYVINRLNSVFENQFIFDSYSCRKGKGTHFGVSRLERFIRSESRNFTREAYVLKLDLRGFFMSIDRKRLFSIVESVVLSKYHDDDRGILLFLLEKVIFNDPTDGCVIMGRKSDWNGLPSSKSLFHSGSLFGLPIGNLTSQILANLFLSVLDRWLKEVKRCRFYGRYVDDFFIVSCQLAFLMSLIPEIDSFLKENLGLTLHPDKIVLVPVYQGVDFLGYCLKPFRKNVSNRVKGNFYEALKGFNAVMDDYGGSVSPEAVLRVSSSFHSYTGVLSHCDSYRLLRGYSLRFLDVRWYQYLNIF